MVNEVRDEASHFLPGTSLTWKLSESARILSNAGTLSRV